MLLQEADDNQNTGKDVQTEDGMKIFCIAKYNVPRKSVNRDNWFREDSTEF